ncbi:MAG: 3-hydroxyacyl-CoA dehydrogenase/enoyl-CoA hydratase family protein [Thermoplasmatota archaeon]
MAIRRVTVIGAGNMGSGIAQACASGGSEVTLTDVSLDAVRKGIDRIAGPLRKRVEAGKMAAAEVDALLARIRPEADFARAVADADLVIEAVFEDLKVKEDVFARLGKFASPQAILATNTSSLSVADLARASGREARVVGLHYFFPAAVNKLVEVVGTSTTDRSVLQDVLEFSRRSGKVPIQTADAGGFAVNRFFVPWVNEAVRLLEENVANIATIEAAAKDAFGITMGPFELMNVTGIPISLHAARSLERAFGTFYAPAKLLETQVASAAPWNLTGTVEPQKTQAVKDRLLGVVVGISTMLVEEKVATAEDTDKGATVGLRWAKGPFAILNDLGTATGLRLVEPYSRRWGTAFPVSPTLRRLAAVNAPWTTSFVRLEVDQGIAVLTIDRPDVLNALDEQVLADLDRAVARCNDDAAIRVLILTGEGKAFVAGADIKAMATKTAVQARVFTEMGQTVFRRLAEGPKPVIAAVNGFAFGGGFELALACDLILASEKASFALPEVTLGIIPGFGGTQRLTRLVGPQTAKWLIFANERVDAAAAERLGIALRVVPHAELLPTAKALASKIATGAPLGITFAKRAANRALDQDLAGGLAYEADLATLAFATADQKEGMRAFIEKRKAVWRGE